MPAFQVTGPDGRKFRVDAPEGASQRDAIEYVATQHYSEYLAAQDKYREQSLANAKQQYDPTEGMSTLDRTIAGVGSGMTRFARGAGNLVGAGHLSDWFGDEAVREQDRLDKPLGDTTAGAVGQAIGQTATSLPLTLGYGAVSSAARAVPLAGRVLGNPLVRGGVEGAANAAAVADVNHQADAAEFGATVGTGASALFGTAGRLVRGLVQKSGAAQDLDRLASQAGQDVFVPVAQAADDGGDMVTRAGKALYKDVLPIAPGVTSKLKNQSARAMDTVREMALDTADPTGTTIQAGAGRTPQAAISALKDAFDQEYQSTVKSYVYDVPQDFRDQVEARIKAALPDVDDTTVAKVTSALDDQMERFSSGKATIDGNNLLNARNSTSEQMSKMRGPEKAALAAGKGIFDDIIQDELSPEVFARYQGLSEPYAARKVVEKAVNAARRSGGQFTPGQLASAARPGSELYPLAQAANATLGQSPTGNRSLFPFYRLGGGYELWHAFHSPMSVLGSVAGAHLLATQTAQRAMMGDTAAQEAIQKLIEAHPEAAAAIQTVIRNAATTQAGATDYAR